MKIQLFCAAFAGLVLLSCSDKNAGNSAIIKSETSATDSAVANAENVAGEQAVRYVADDGSSAHVTFGQNDDGKIISVKSNNKTIAAPLLRSSDGAEIYGSHDMEIKSANDSVIITQGDNVITLKKARGQ